MPRKQGRWSPDDQRKVAPEARLPPPEPPPELEAREAYIWREITGKLPGDWFAPETTPMLKELCRHIRHADDLAIEMAEMRAAIESVKQSETMTIVERMAAIAQGSKAMAAMLRAHGYQSERIGNLATKLRLTNQAKIPAGSAARKARDEMQPTGVRPWDAWGDRRDN
jgi:hypothetical protein